MMEEERDIVEFTDEEGNTLLLEVVDSFFYNGQEFAVLADVEDEECDCKACEGDCAHDHEENLYIMKIEQSVDEDGEEIEEFVPVEESLMEALIEVVQTRLMEDDDDDEDGEGESDGNQG